MQFIELSKEAIVLYSSIFTVTYIMAELLLAAFFFVNDSTTRWTFASLICGNNRFNLKYYVEDYVFVFIGSVVLSPILVFIVACLFLIFQKIVIIFGALIGALFGTRALVRFSKTLNKVRKTVNEHKHDSNGNVRQQDGINKFKY